MYVITPQLENKDWRDTALKNFIVREERSLLEVAERKHFASWNVGCKESLQVIAFSGILRMSRDEASRLSIKLAVDSGNPLGTLTIVRLVLLRCTCERLFSLNFLLKLVQSKSHGEISLTRFVTRVKK